MKQRHMPFEITPKRAERWLSCMKDAFKETGLDQNSAAGPFYDRLMQVAAIMVNSFE
jgi:hemoglobin